MKLAGKVAIVTGTSPNIGGGIAGGLADEGARVACVDVLADNAHQCAEWITSRGGSALGLTCDVTDEAQVQAMVARVARRLGRHRHSRQQRGHPRRPQRARDAARALEPPARRQSHRDVSVHQARGPAHGRAGDARQHHRDRVHGRPPGPGREHRLLHEQERPAQLHAGGRHGSLEARHPGQQPHADGHRRGGRDGAGGGLGPRPAGAAVPACSTSRGWCRPAGCRARATTRRRRCSSPRTTPR